MIIENFYTKIDLNNIQARDIMIPRNNMIYIKSSDDKQTVINKFINSNMKYLPVCHHSLDDMIGICSLNDILLKDVYNIDDSNYNLLFVPENQIFFNIISIINNTKTPICLIVDEFGGTCGMVSQESVVNFFSNFHISGSESVQRFSHIIPDNILTNIQSETIGGFIMEFLGKIPNRGDCFVLNNHEFTILEMNRNTIKAIAIKSMVNR